MRQVQTLKKLDPDNIQNIEITYLIMTSKVKVTALSFFHLTHFLVHLHNLIVLDLETNKFGHFFKVHSYSSC